ncbi:MAG: hypothetical protein J5970_05380 [Bacilli bacterium]|nr:hypothetical protein [Bacilli bacterium]
MKKKILLGLLSLVLVFTVTGCFAKKGNDPVANNVKKDIKGNCRALECVKKLKPENKVEEINKVIGFEGKLTDEKNKIYTWEIASDEKVTASYYSSDKATIEATYDKDELKNNKISFAKYDEIQSALKSGSSLSYDEFCKKVNGNGVLYSVSSYSKKYVWVNKNGEYLTGTFSTTTNKCTFVIGRINKSGN